jgi:hypothetical protein
MPVTVLHSTTAGTKVWSAPGRPSVTGGVEGIAALSNFQSRGTVAEQRRHTWNMITLADLIRAALSGGFQSLGGLTPDAATPFRYTPFPEPFR